MDLSSETCFEALQSRHYVARVAALRTLSRMGREVEQLIPTFIATLEDPNSGLRDVAAEALGAIGPRARAAIPALREILTARDAFVRNAAQRALARINRGGAPEE